MKTVSLVSCALCLFRFAAWGTGPAEELPPVPHRYFNDFANSVAPNFVEQKDRQLEDFGRVSSDQFIVAIFPKLPPDTSLDDYCLRTFNAWGVGQKGVNNGVVLFVFSENRKLRIEIGRGLEKTLTNAKSQEIVDRMVKCFKKGDFPAGFDAGVTGVIDVLRAAGTTTTAPVLSPPEAVPPQFTAEQVAPSQALLAHDAEKGREKDAALDAVRDSAPFVSEFVRLFPGAKVAHRYFTKTDEPGFDVEVGLYGHYELTMQLPVHFDAERRKVVGYGQPEFDLLEAASRAGNSTFYNPAGERHFGSAGWRTLVKHGGDFSSIGYTMHADQPTPGSKDARAQP